MPSGGTELACLLKCIYRWFNSNPSLLLIPISFHSMKNDYSEEVDSNKLTNRNIKMIVGEDNNMESVIIVDDNSSTGSTIEAVRKAFSEIFSCHHIYCTVAEADLVRTRVDIDCPNRKNVASPDLFSSTVSVLPVSKRRYPKRDLKEIAEKHMLVQYYKRKKRNTNSIVKKNKYEAFIDCIFNEVNYNLDDPNSISDFRKNELSNFHPCEIVYDGTIYKSVEHAYLRAKFCFENIKLTKDHQRSIQSILHSRDERYNIKDGLELLFKGDFGAGTVKQVSKELRQYGFVRADWHIIKTNIMIELLRQKFSHGPLRDYLVDTYPKNLIEGNVWCDTYWGYDITENRGKNLLGRILMIIREEIIMERHNK